MSESDPRYPMGAPLNRQDAPTFKPSARGPGWFIDAKGHEKYVEPPKPPLPYAICAKDVATGLSPAVLHAAAAVTRARLDQLAACWRARSAAERGVE